MKEDVIVNRKWWVINKIPGPILFLVQDEEREALCCGKFSRTVPYLLFTLKTGYFARWTLKNIRI